jgi:hypothetical protein
MVVKPVPEIDELPPLAPRAGLCVLPAPPLPTVIVYVVPRVNVKAVPPIDVR